jgi:predicted DNA-binding transcriptional regulator YafY
MSQRPDTMETLRLTLELLKRIPRHGKISAPELQHQLAGAGLARNLRTIQRQLDMLSQHFEIERDERSKPYGYKWKEHARGISVPTLNEQESLLLTLSERYLRNILPSSVMKSMAGFIEQARGNLRSDGKAKRELEWLNKIRIVSVTQPLLAPAIKAGIFEAVSKALFDNCWLEVEYRNAKGGQTRATVMPLGLAQQGPRLYLVCRFRGYDNERSLALHRIATANVSAMTFERPADFSLDKFDDDGRFGFGEGKRIRLKIRIAKEAGQHLLESPLADDQLVKELAETYEITATVVETEQLRWWLRGFGGAVEVLVPKGLLRD